MSWKKGVKFPVGGRIFHLDTTSKMLWGVHPASCIMSNSDCFRVSTEIAAWRWRFTSI